ncbi:MAG: hypothetical protein J3Q66DRAFT_329858 [Benniella sp.]|nr:MAG: hypothetical protein J3Q66DRAFT_329858 [Benniella sp.]
MLAKSARRPFSGVCSTVSCWALLFSIIFPPTNVLGVEINSAPSAHDQHRSHYNRINKFRHHRSSAPAHDLAINLGSTLEWLSVTAPCTPLLTAHVCLPDIAGGNCRDTGCNSGTVQQKAPSQRKRSSPQDFRAAVRKAVAIGSKDRSMCIVDPTRTQSLGKIDSRSLQDDYERQQCLISTKSPNQVAIARLSIRKKERHHQGGHSNNRIKDGPLPHRHHSDPNSMDTIWGTDPHHFLESNLPVIEEHDDNTDSGMDTLWHGHVYAAENSAAGGYHSFTGPILRFPVTLSQSTFLQVPWMAWMTCTSQSMEHLLTAAELGAIAVVFHSASPQGQERDDCIARLLEKKGAHVANQGSITYIPTIFKLDHQMADGLDVILSSLASATPSFSSNPKEARSKDIGPQRSGSGITNVPKSRATSAAITHEATDVRPIGSATPSAGTTTTTPISQKSKPLTKGHASTRKRVRVGHSPHPQDLEIPLVVAVRRLIQKTRSFSLTKFIQDSLWFVKDDTVTGRMVMILMSAICGVGVGMIGALLFVVLLKFRRFQARPRAYPSQTRLHSQRPIQWQSVARPKTKRVLPEWILQSFGVQTVLEASSTVVLTSPVGKCEIVEKMTKFKQGYADDAIEGLEDVAASTNTLQQRLRTRTSHLFSHAATGTDAESSSVSTTAGESHTEEWDGLFEDEEMEEVSMAHSDYTPLSRNAMPLLSRGSHDATAAITDVATDIMSLMRRRQTSESHQGHQEHSVHDASMMDKKQQVCTAIHSSTAENKQQPFANADAQTSCSICLMEYEVGEQVRTLPCYHQYHASCIDPWLLNVTTLCPICKRDLWPVSE